MIVDTSALVAVAYRKPGADALIAALLTEAGFLIAPVIVEFRRVTAVGHNRRNPAADALLAELLDARIAAVPFDMVAAEFAVEANAFYGSGGGLGGPLNMLDLMVYGAAKATGLPILCTGNDFAATDAVIHPASRTA